MGYYVYILFSSKFDKFYIGQTNDISDRIKRHNSGSEPATAPYRLWELKWFTEKPDRKEAMSLERKLKNLTKERIRDFIKKYS